MTKKFTGYIYKVVLCDAETKENKYPEFCYIGQTKEDSIQRRWKKHLKEASDWSKKTEEKKNATKSAKLHKAMFHWGTENIAIVEVEKVQKSYVFELVYELDRLEEHYINKYDCISIGWNKAKVNKKRRKRIDKIKEKYKGERDWKGLVEKDYCPEMLEYDVFGKHCEHQDLKKICNWWKIPYNTFLAKLENDRSPEKIGTVVEEMVTEKNRPTELYVYYRQDYESINELCRKNKGPTSACLGNRIKKAKENGTLESELGERENAETKEKEKVLRWQITESMMKVPPKIESKPRDKRLWKVNTPKGERECNTFRGLYDLVKKEFPETVPDKFSGVRKRIKGDTTEDWTMEEAFGFDVPPNYRDVDKLVKEKGYKYFPKKPTSHCSRVPIVSHETKEVFIVQTEWMKEYGLMPRSKEVINFIKDGKSPEWILRHFGKTP